MYYIVCACVFVALVTQHTLRARRFILTSVACQVLPYFSAPFYIAIRCLSGSAIFFRAVLYCHSLPVRFCHIFPRRFILPFVACHVLPYFSTSSQKDTIFGKWLWNIKCVSISSTTSVSYISRSKKNSVRDKRTQVFM